MTLVIIAAGIGSRYGGGGIKQIDPVTRHGEFILDYSIYDAIRAGFDRVVLVIRRDALGIFEGSIGRRIGGKIELTYAFQEIGDIPAGLSVPEGRSRPWGTAHAVLGASEAVGGDNFMVINADDFYGRDAYVKTAGFFRGSMTAGGFESAAERCCMVGYRLGNTTTEHGTVSRGICEIREDGRLLEITECKNIKRGADGSIYTDGEVLAGRTPRAFGNPSGGGVYPLPADKVVSMNCWGFTPAVFGYIRQGFSDFLASESGGSLTSEYYLPGAVEEMVAAGRCEVSVLSTSAKWYGVTYAEDKPYVVEQLGELTKSGEYPDGLWR